MHQTLLRVLALLCLAGCHPINNKINNLEYDCGEMGDLTRFRYVKLFNSTGSIDHPEEIKVRNEAGENLSGLLTAKACIKVDKSWNQKLIAVRPRTGEGLIFFPERIQDGLVMPLNLKAYRYGKLASLCKTSIATSAHHLEWPIDFKSIEVEAFEWNLTIYKNEALQLKVHHTGFADLGKEAVDISSLADGSYRLSIQANPLFSEQKQESIFDCELLIDRQSPVVAVDRELVRVDGEDELAIQAAPGEAIKIRTTGSGSIDSIYACLLPQEKAAANCKFDQIAGGFVTAPQSGSWILRLYAEDQANNQGPILERGLLVYDNNLVGVIKAYVEQAVVSQKSGASLFAMIFGIKAYEKMKTLGSKTEMAAVAQGVRKAVLESMLLPVEDFLLKLEQNNFTFGLGLWRTDNETLFLQKRVNNDLELFSLNGQLNRKIDMQAAHGTPASSIGFRYCESTNLLMSYAKNKIVFFDKDFVQKIVTLSDKIDLNSIAGEVSEDCTVAMLEGREAGITRQVLVDMKTKEAESLGTPVNGYLVGYLDAAAGRKLLTRLGPGQFLLYDRETKQSVPLSEALGLDVIDVKQMRDGTTGVLSRDKSLTVWNHEGKKAFSKERVDYFAPSQKAGEILVITDEFYLQVLSTADGTIKSRVGVSGPNWSYLSATEDFIVGLSAGSNVVKIWTRTGNPLDDIYNKGDSIRRVWLSPLGYLYVESNQYLKLFKLKNDLSKKQVPHFWNALGLQFTADGHHVVYKEQQPEMQDMQNYAVNNLVQWNIEKDERTLYNLPQPAFSSKPYPGYGSQTRDLEYFTQDDQPYVASTMKRGSIAIYHADDLGTPIEQHELTSNWLLDIAVDPSGDVLAAASQNGLVFVVGRKNGGWGATSLTDVYPQYFEEYPVTLNFDKTGRFLFVTDLNRNLMKYAVAFKEDTKEYVLTLQGKVEEAGVNLAINKKGDMLAVVGQGAKLKLLDTNLKVLKEYNLSSSSITLGQSVTFSPDGTKVYAGVYDGTWNELDLKSGQLLKVRFSSNETGASNIVVAPAGDRIAFMGGGFVQVADLNVDRVYKNICSWLLPRLPYIPDLSEDDRKLCQSVSSL